MKRNDSGAGTIRSVRGAIGMAAAAWVIFCVPGYAQEAPFPDYYPPDYQELVTAAEAEGGELTVYSSYQQSTWDPVFKAFREKYPFVRQVKNLDLEGEEVYQKLKIEHSLGNPVADIVEIQPSVGAKLRDEQELLLPYETAEASQYPAEQLSPYPNGFQYAISALVMGYNAKVLPEPVTSLEQLADLVAQSDGKYAVGVRNISSGFAFGMYHALLTGRPDLWEQFEVILPHAKPEGSSGSLLTKLQTGEYAAAVFMADSTMVPAASKSAGLLGVALAQDGTPFQGAAVSISARAPHPATAKLFVDFMLSQEGQQAILQGGRAAVRDGLEPVEGLYSFDQATADLPEESIVVAPFAEVPAAEVQAFSARWNGLLGH